jgi:hypothetical protein
LEYVRGVASLHLKHQQAVSEIVISLRGRLSFPSRPNNIPVKDVSDFFFRRT